MENGMQKEVDNMGSHGFDCSGWAGKAIVPCHNNVLLTEVSNLTMEQSLYSKPTITLEGGLIGVIPKFDFVFCSLKAKKIIYNNPVTVVLWEDKTKTVVRCQDGDEYNPMLGLALCYMKKALGNSSRKLNDALHAEGF